MLHMLSQTKTQIKIRQKFPLIMSSVAIVMGLTVVPQVLADELVISGNGANSDSQIQTSTSSNTNVQQSNNADVNNDVKVTANTGENKASDNTGGSTSVNTGNATSSTTIDNSVNKSFVNLENCNTCGESHGSISINGNGAFSTNRATVNASSRINVHVNQDADITNNVDESLVTGKNKANDNTGGDVSISSGNITSRDRLLNELLNFSDIKVAGGPLHDFWVNVFGNGAYSDNDAHVNLNNHNNVLVDNALALINNLKHRFVTGENDAKDNTGGDVSVATGDITSDVEISNVANISKVAIECNCVTPTPAPSNVPTPTSSPAPTTAPTSAASTPTPTASAAAQEQVLGASAILPVTGSNLFFFMMIGNVVMLLMGAYLRLRSGRSPGMGI
jgi:hypothetical protein